MLQQIWIESAPEHIHTYKVCSAFSGGGEGKQQSQTSLATASNSVIRPISIHCGMVIKLLLCVYTVLLLSFQCIMIEPTSITYVSMWYAGIPILMPSCC